MRQSLKLGPINQAFPDNPVPWRDRVNTLLVNMCNSYMLKLRHIWPYVKSTLIFLEALKGMSPMFLPLLGFPYLFLPAPPAPVRPPLVLLFSKPPQGSARGFFTQIPQSLFLIQWLQDYAHSQGSSSASQQGDWCTCSPWSWESFSNICLHSGWGVMGNCGKLRTGF